MAEAVIRTELADSGLADRVSVQSAGTGDWHLGEPMDRGALAELRRRGYDGSTHRARQIGPDWLDRFDLLIATDQANLRSLLRMAAGLQCWPPGGDPPGSPPPGLQGRIRLLRSFDPQAPEGAEVPDPYGAGPREFAKAFDMIQAAASGLVAELAKVLADAGG